MSFPELRDPVKLGLEPLAGGVILFRVLLERGHDLAGALAVGPGHLLRHGGQRLVEALRVILKHGLPLLGARRQAALEIRGGGRHRALAFA